MNYAWQLMLQADKENIERESLRFINADNPSPYMEVSMEDLNVQDITGRDEHLLSQVEVNPLYRFSREFGSLFSPDIMAMRQAREIFFDISMHYIVQLDLRSGLTRQDFYLRFLQKDALMGVLGNNAKEALTLFSADETIVWMSSYLQLLKTGHYRWEFRQTVTAIYQKAILYENNDTANETLLYLGVAESGRERKRITFLTGLLLPIQENVHIFYDHHFGIIGVDETMRLDETILI